MTEQECLAIVERYFERQALLNKVTFFKEGSAKGVRGYKVEVSGNDDDEVMTRAIMLKDKAESETSES